MIEFYIAGGLANKMFQYAFSLRLKELGYDVYYNVESFKAEFEHENVSLMDIFPNSDMEIGKYNLFPLLGKNDVISKISKRISNLIRKKYFFESNYKFDSKISNKINGISCFEGAWQNEGYFKDAEKEVRNAFKFPDFVDERNITIENTMKSSNSVAIHIRKGDGYGTWDIFKGTCEKEYYHKAIAHIKKTVEEPRYFVFSDNHEVVNHYLNGLDYILINWNPQVGKKNYLDMQLMSCAKHNIIANSTYSWWGAWLNENPDKVIIAPNDWFNPTLRRKFRHHKIVPKNWIKK
jgi:hypothetical protein